MISLAVLDVAGTTVNVTDGVPNALIDAFAEHELHVSESQVREVRGISKREAIRTLVAGVTEAEANPDLVESLLAAFRAKLQESYRAQPIEALAGAADAIRSLTARRISVWLSTGFDREMAELVVERAGLSELVDGLATDDDVVRGRPAPDLIRFAMAHSGTGDPKDVVAVGDTTADLEAAAAAGVRCAAGVLTGAHDRRRLGRLPHDLLLESIADLPYELARLGLID